MKNLAMQMSTTALTDLKIMPFADCLAEFVSTESQLPKHHSTKPTSTTRRSIALRTGADR